MRPTFSILIGSAGRPTLAATLESIASQDTIPGDQIYVGFDAYKKPLAALEALAAGVAQYNDLGAAEFIPYTYLGIADTEKRIPPPWSKLGDRDHVIPAGAPYYWLGVEQINHALRTYPISGSHVLTLGDDDVFVPGAFDVIRAAAATDQARPVLWQFLAPWRAVLWDRPRLAVGRISGCCIAAPRQYVGLHPTAIDETHDYHWIRAIVDAARAHGRPPIWLEYLAVVARPAAGEAYGDRVAAARIVAEVGG
jgi:hypothetical protein